MGRRVGPGGGGFGGRGAFFVMSLLPNNSRIPVLPVSQARFAHGQGREGALGTAPKADERIVPADPGCVKYRSGGNFGSSGTATVLPDSDGMNVVADTATTAPRHWVGRTPTPGEPRRLARSWPRHRGRACLSRRSSV